MLGPWLWGSPETFEAMIRGPGARRAARPGARRALPRGERAAGCRRRPTRSSSARRCRSSSRCSCTPSRSSGSTPRARSGASPGALEQLEGTLLDWVLGESPRPAAARDDGVRVAAGASGSRSSSSQLVAILDSRDEEAWALAAVAAATPYLFFERQRALGSPRGAHPRAATAARSRRARWRAGSRTLWRRGTRGARRSSGRSARCARWRGTRGPTSLDESRRWIEVIAVTDAVDGAERDPLDLELGLENLMRLAAQYDDEEADARAARFAGALAPTFLEARRIALGHGPAPAAGGGASTRSRAARAPSRCASGGRCWRRALAGEPDRGAGPRGDVEDARARAGGDPRSRRRSGAAGDGGRASTPTLPLEVLAIRLGGYALDACGEDADARARPRPDGARHLPLAPQARGPRRRLARAARRRSRAR